MAMIDETSFRARLAQDGFDEVLVREWAPGQVVDEHDHPFDARLLVLRGGFTLTRPEGAEWLGPGHGCELARGIRHAEHYGPEGCSVLVGRRRA